MKATFERIYSNISAKRTHFFVAFFIVVLITYAILYALDFYPEPKTTSPEDEINGNTTEIVEEGRETEGVEETVAEETSPEEAREFSIESTPARTEDNVFPTRVVIPASDTDVTILNPASVDMNDLDNALLSGVIRHPQSADLDDRGNMLLLGHSSYLPTVFNKNFQAFNGVQNLSWGDEIFVYGEQNEVRTYRVERVYLAKASETVIDNSWGKSKLTLVTCNSFASKDDRYIVEATLVSS